MSLTSRPAAVHVIDSGLALRPDPGRTILRFFLPGNEDVGPGDSRAGPVIERILGLSDAEVAETLRQVDARFGSRRPDLDGVFEAHAALVAHRLEDAGGIDSARRRLLGAVFTHEYSIEGAALCNPSIVRHPEQAANGDVRFVLSVRGIGEGHRSSIGFRTGTVTAGGHVALDDPGCVPRTGSSGSGTHHRAVLHRKLAELGDDHENAAYVLDPLPEQFSDVELEARLVALADDAVMRRHAVSTIANLHELARSSYRVEFPTSSELSDRVLWPYSPMESHGMEDARFVEMVDGAAPRYCATYTAFDGTHINQNLLATDDFARFEMAPMAGQAARGKGLALFPRQVGGRFVALSRSDRETNSIAYSNDLRCWDVSHVIQAPRWGWEVVQLGNCGSPIETEAGWLVLTHGVGPMRVYSIGAILLDLDEPHRVLAATETPILSPGVHDGYVPNVVYTCGAMAVGDRLVLPFGIGDQSVSIVTLSIDELLGTMRYRA